MSQLLKELGYVPEHDLAASIGNEVGTLRNWRAKGIGPAYTRAGGQIVYPLDAIRDWLADNRVTPEPLPGLIEPGTRRGGRPRKTPAAA